MGKDEMEQPLSHFGFATLQKDLALINVDFIYKVDYKLLTVTRKTIPLRARKRAQTRLALVDALLDRLSKKTIEEIFVSDLAEMANISQGTFFNYFPSKADLLTHFIQLWSLKMSAMARQIEKDVDRYLTAIEALFVATAEEVAPHPQVMLEIIAHQARMPTNLQLTPIELAERVLFLPNEDDVESLSDAGLGQLLPPLLQAAIENGELPSSCNIDTLTLAAVSVFFGVPLIFARRQPQAIAPLYRQQLALVWAGACSTTD